MILLLSFIQTFHFADPFMLHLKKHINLEIKKKSTQMNEKIHRK